MTKLAPEWVRTSDPVIRSPARYRWTTAPAFSASCKSFMMPYFHSPSSHILLNNPTKPVVKYLADVLAFDNECYYTNSGFRIENGIFTCSKLKRAYTYSDTIKHLAVYARCVNNVRKVCGLSCISMKLSTAMHVICYNITPIPCAFA